MRNTKSRRSRAVCLILVIAHASAFSPSWGPRPTVAPVMLFGFGRDTSSGLADTVLKTRKALERNQAFKARTEQYVKGAITANDLVKTYEQEVAAKMAGIDLQDIVEAALETIPNQRKRDLLSTASRGRAIGVGGKTVAAAVRSSGRDVTINGQRAQYVMQQGVQRVSSGKTTILDGVEVGKEGIPLKFKCDTRSSATAVSTEVENLQRIRNKNGAGAYKRHFVGFTEYVKDYNGRGNSVMVMQAESMDMRKLADTNRGNLAPGALRKYAREMFAVVRCLDKADLVWTDFKLDNLVLCKGGEVKAIDLENAVPARSAPNAYTPLSLPPDFASAATGGFGGATVDRSYHIWGLGMAILHLYMGRGYFDGKTDPQIIAQVSKPGFAVDLSAIKDGRLRSVLEGLLDPAPTKRVRFFDSPTTRLALL